MTARRRARRGQAGFTLVELMISLVLFSFVIAGVLAVAVAMAAGFREQKVTVGAESSARAVMEFMAEAVRGASPGVPDGATRTLAGVPGGSIIDTDGSGGTCALGAIEVVNSSAAPDELRLVFSYGSVTTSTAEPVTEANAGGTVDVVDATGLAGGDLVLITNFVTGHILKLQSVTGNELTLTTFGCTTAGTFSYPAGAVVVRVARAHFTIALLDNIPTLSMDPDSEGIDASEPMAEGIEDMQIEIGVDRDGNGQLDEVGLAADDDDWIHNVTGEVMPVGTPRALRISLLARAVGKLTGMGTVAPPVLGDRAPWGTADNFRRRVLTSTIEIRNVVGSR